ncbi:hypothetical protein DMUE_2324 [Dictyocoela muelleri]|nr:hypothetical protein DMUE_2324 [Dictyocoela muelleri]
MISMNGIEKNKKIIILFMIIIILISIIAGCILLISPLVLDENDRYIKFIQENKEKNKFLNRIFKDGFDDAGKDVCNSFIFIDRDVDFFTKRVENVDELMKLKINNENSGKNKCCKLINEALDRFNRNFIGPFIEIDYENLIDKNIGKELSWVSYLYGLFGGYSICKEINDICIFLKKYEQKIDNGIVGVAFLNDIAYLFFYNTYKNKVEEFTKIYPYEDKLKPLDILFYFLKFTDLIEIKKSN